MPKAAKIAIVIVAVLILIGILVRLFAGVILKKIMSGAIQQKTGVETNLNDIQNGKLEFTDPKTGAKLNIGGNKIPTDFPKDFPIYPGTTVTSSLSGNQTGNGNGFWLTLTTDDSTEKVTSFYESNLKTNGWTLNTTQGAGVGTNWVVSKDKLSGYLTIDRPQDQNQTSILIVLGNAK